MPPLTQTPYKILVLCTGNSARSILAEYLLREHGRGRFETFSAGAKPTGRVNPFAVRVLRDRYGIDASGARSKHADEFRGVPLDLVITVCGNAREACPVWPGVPVLAHWGSPDPAAIEGTDEQKYRAFAEVAAQIAQRAELFAALPAEKLRDATAIRAIGDAAKFAGEDTMKP